MEEENWRICLFLWTRKGMKEKRREGEGWTRREDERRVREEKDEAADE